MPVAARPICEALGTEITGVDLAHLSDVDFAAIDEVFRDHPVLVFRHQKLSAGALAAFGTRFGRPQPACAVAVPPPGPPRRVVHHQCRERRRDR